MNVLVMPGWAGERLDLFGFHKLPRSVMLVDIDAGPENNVSSITVNGLAH